MSTMINCRSYCIPEWIGSDVGPQCCHLSPDQGDDLVASFDLLINSNELVCTVHHNNEQLCPLDCPLVCFDRWHLVGEQEVQGEQGCRGWGEACLISRILSFCKSDENQTLMEDMISTQTNFFPWPKSWPDELKNLNPTSSKMDLLPSTAPTWPRCSPSGTPRRPPPPPRLTEKTWQVSEK